MRLQPAAVALLCAVGTDALPQFRNAAGVQNAPRALDSLSEGAIADLVNRKRAQDPVHPGQPEGPVHPGQPDGPVHPGQPAKLWQPGRRPKEGRPKKDPPKKTPPGGRRPKKDPPKDPPGGRPKKDPPKDGDEGNRPKPPKKGDPKKDPPKDGDEGNRPKPPKKGHPKKDPPKDGDEGNRPKPPKKGDPKKDPPKDDDDDDKNVCEMGFESLDDGKKTWKDSGAEKFLEKFLKDKGVKGWGSKIFKETVAGGKQGGSTYDCESFPNGQCDLPEKNVCKSYSPHEMFFVQIAMSNLYNAFDTIYKELDAGAVEALGSTANKIKGTFGSPDTDGTFPLLIGSAVMGAAMAGPLWKVAAPMTAMVGILNLAAGADAMTKPDEESSLDQQVIDSYTTFRDVLKKTVEAVYSGNFKGVNFDGDEVDFIMDAFGDGKMLVTQEKNDAVDSYLEGFRKLMKASLIFKILSDNGWYLLLLDTKEKNCDAQTDDTGVWMKVGDEERCVSIAKPQTNGNDFYGGEIRQSLQKNKFKAFKDEFDIDVEEAFKNIIDCDGGKMDYKKKLDTDTKGYPKCMLPMKAEKKS